MNWIGSIGANEDPMLDGTGAEVTSLEDARVIDRLEAYAAAIEDGNRPDRETVLSEFPQLADRLAGCLETIELICLNSQIWTPLAIVDGHDDKQMSRFPVA